MPPAALGWQAWCTGAIVLAMIAVLSRARFGPDLVLMGALLLLLLIGAVEPAQAVAGFANPAVITVAMLYIVATAMKQTGAMNFVADRLIARPASARGAQARIALPVAILSAFVNNTPIVAMFLPTLKGIARRSRLPVGQLFMPLSFASILGGTCTLIGTSTNIVVHSALRDSGHDGFGMFTLAWVGLPIALFGLVYILLFAGRLLPGMRDIDEQDAAAGQYHTALRITAGSPLIGKTIAGAELRHLPGLFLSRVDRGTESIVVGPNFRLAESDILLFVGAVESLVDLQRFRGLVPVADGQRPDEYRPNLRLFEAVVSTESSLAGRSIRDAGIRTRYGAAVIGVRRSGLRIRGKLGDAVLRPGDTLLLEAPQGAGQRLDATGDFYLSSERQTPAALRHDRAWIALLVLIALVVAITLGLLSPMVAAMGAAAAMILTRCCTGPQARAGVDLPVLVVIGAAFGVGAAMTSTGLAGAIADLFINAAGPLGPWALLGAVYALTVLFTMTMTNNAAALLMFPIALAVTRHADPGLNIMPFAVAIAVGASCEFSTPIGYQTNLMVMGPGGYRWSDYLRFGGPLTILCGTICVLLAALIWPLS